MTKAINKIEQNKSIMQYSQYIILYNISVQALLLFCLYKMYRHNNKMLNAGKIFADAAEKHNKLALDFNAVCDELNKQGPEIVRIRNMYDDLVAQYNAMAASMNAKNYIEAANQYENLINRTDLDAYDRARIKSAKAMMDRMKDNPEMKALIDKLEMQRIEFEQAVENDAAAHK